ncbi:hypothetical protein HPP92_023895 [Vanilla planifolia]|uniref:Uncharacterized protein n=1 Tax=Vanilla planifolia TaxID=51239 RepID=A0A835PR63_VANPL|nr:hypothetical protein HPP92_023895 [Vanilla planifolia]
MEQDATLGEEGLEIAVLDERDHEEEETNGEEKQAGEGIGGLDQKLVVRGRALELRRRFSTVAEHRYLVQVEHHQRPAGGSDRRVQEADREEGGCGRGRGRRHGGSEFQKP